jgi:hypothetical protein
MKIIKIEKTIQSDTIQLPELKGLVGKRVRISIKQIRNYNRLAQKIGSSDLGGRFDNTNIRDLAYDN